MIMKAAAITGATSISVTNKDRNVTISVRDRKYDSASNFKKSLDTSLDSFNAFIAVENFKIVPAALEVSVAKTSSGTVKILHFKHRSRPLPYFTLPQLSK